MTDSERERGRKKEKNEGERKKARENKRRKQERKRERVKQKEAQYACFQIQFDVYMKMSTTCHEFEEPATIETKEAPSHGSKTQ